jgi:sensitive to high expression protein 9, mitochondrial
MPPKLLTPTTSPNSILLNRPQWIPGRTSICPSCRLQARIRLYSSAKSSKSQLLPSNHQNEPPSAAKPTEPAADPTSQAELPSASESRRSPLLRSLSNTMDALQGRVLVASQRLNDLTGYTAIEAIKARNEALEARLRDAQAALAAARETYKATHARRAATQREVTALLARKETWAPADLERFTALYREDHGSEAGVAAAAAQLSEAEAAEGRLSAELSAGMLRRYHEEQIWSDRIRRQSTWGTWGLMGVNVVLFLVLQFFAEPWRRARLVKGVAEAERGAMDEVRKELEALRDVVSRGQDEATIAPVAAVPRSDIVTVANKTHGSWSEVLLHPHRWRAAVSDLYSERRIELRMRDASLIAFEGALAGAALAVVSAAFLIRKP